MSFCKIIGFTKQIYENKSLSPNHVFTFKISGFTTYIFLFIILMKIHEITNKNIEIVNLEILKVKVWFGDKALFS